jgi:hypothetical protein
VATNLKEPARTQALCWLLDELLDAEDDLLELVARPRGAGWLEAGAAEGVQPASGGGTGSGVSLPGAVRQRTGRLPQAGVPQNFGRVGRSRAEPPPGGLREGGGSLCFRSQPFGSGQGTADSTAWGQEPLATLAPVRLPAVGSPVPLPQLSR